VHKKYLEMNSVGFAAPDSEVEFLSESSTVLDLLLQHIYPGPQPDLGEIEFAELAGVAEAAQKYEVWSAMSVTKVHMRYVRRRPIDSCPCFDSGNRNAAPQHGFDVLVYASKHDIPDLANEAIKFCCNVPIAEAFKRLINPKYFKGFVSYRAHSLFDQLESMWLLLRLDISIHGVKFYNKPPLSPLHIMRVHVITGHGRRSRSRMHWVVATGRQQKYISYSR
jgi:hypothetical protein